jgi:hypothetical protein
LAVADRHCEFITRDSKGRHPTLLANPYSILQYTHRKSSLHQRLSFPHFDYPSLLLDHHGKIIRSAAPVSSGDAFVVHNPDRVLMASHITRYKTGSSFSIKKSSTSGDASGISARSSTSYRGTESFTIYRSGSSVSRTPIRADGRDADEDPSVFVAHIAPYGAVGYGVGANIFLVATTS